MAKIIARNAQIFVGGRDVSGQLNTFTQNLTTETPEVTAFGNAGRQRLSAGLRDTEFSLNGFYDAAASQVDEQFTDLVNASSLYGIYYGSASVQETGRELYGVMTGYNLDSAVEGATALSATIAGGTGGSGLLEVHSMGYRTFSAVASNVGQAETAASLGASTAAHYGVVRIIGLNRSSGNEEVTVRIQHSITGASWETLTIFTTASGGGTYEVVGPAAASAYRRAHYSWGGTSPFSACILVAAGSYL